MSGKVHFTLLLLNLAGADPMDADASVPLNLHTIGSPFLQKSPQKIRTLFVSPRKTPLLFHRRSAGPPSLLLNLGDLRSPRASLDLINSVVQGQSPAGPISHGIEFTIFHSSTGRLTSSNARKKLDFGQAMSSSDVLSYLFLTSRTNTLGLKDRPIQNSGTRKSDVDSTTANAPPTICSNFCSNHNL